MVSDSSFGQLPISVLMMYRILSLVLLLTAVTGCENLIEIELPDSSSEIVVLAPFTTHIPWQVTLQRTASVYDTSPTPAVIENASVTIQGEDGSVVELSDWGGGFYTSPTTFPKVGVTYTLTVEAEGFKRVEARDRIPEPVTVRDVRISDIGGIRYFDVEIEDDGNVENYYELTITDKFMTGNQKFIVTSLELEEQMRNFAIQDPISPDVTRPPLNRALIRDTPFNGERYVISFNIEEDDILEQSVYIHTVSRAYYEYYRSKIIQENANKLPFAEFAGVLSNVKNGQGVFAGYHLHVHGDVTYQSVKDRLIGTYTATSYTYEYTDPDECNGCTGTDYLAEGASIELTLNSDYSTTGQMRLPPLGLDAPGDEAEVVSLDGGYSIVRRDPFYGYYGLSFYHSSDTILRDVLFLLLPPSQNPHPLAPPVNLEHFTLESLYDWKRESSARYGGGFIVLSRAEE